MSVINTQRMYSMGEFKNDMDKAIVDTMVASFEAYGKAKTTSDKVAHDIKKTSEDIKAGIDASFDRSSGKKPEPKLTQE